ncbi:TPA: hypothetical protein ACLFOW_000965 [Yersinia enterocolitica]|jgi:hypothetical protein|uniref:Uncharacterized protein n=1 Tax=Yersinia intermedia TaxID=631 RepID=A0A208ZML1_YERIN|nr:MULTISPECIES: hypothetical protein [Yersinia]EKN3579045.1 hypothetical protein [Yersinia enterocolitica]EKN4817760.1 hypothetical protein [Yersinia enterocolitica]EKN4835055.1 hypothetical protein [Yersinia enterocolitica]EKN6178090.1 hypothetical protein [Yersinia enterocolitica]MCB5298785.1 hypothetical protein [Yersinia intermedia]
MDLRQTLLLSSTLVISLMLLAAPVQAKREGDYILYRLVKQQNSPAGGGLKMCTYKSEIDGATVDINVLTCKDHVFYYPKLGLFYETIN